jgi:two-component system chemotaxis response regulator CheB
MAQPADNDRRKTRVLVVDDSIFMRKTIERILTATGDIEVVGSASDGAEALRQALALRPDVITMDVEMPRMDGVTAVREIVSILPIPVVMVSTMTTQGAETTMKALEAGAVDYVAKPSALTRDLEAVGVSIARAVQTARHARVRKPSRISAPSTQPLSTGPAMTGRPSRNVVVVGSSTGGPAALTEVIPALPADLDAGVLVVQHMPAGFTEVLAKRLDGASPLHVAEAKEGDVVQQGFVLVAPGHRHIEVTPEGRIRLKDTDAVHGVKPSVDVALQSIARSYGRNALVAILTGMGRDGASGAALVAANGGTVLVQDEASCVIYGMPRAALDATPSARTVALGSMAQRIADCIQRMKTPA